MKRILPVALILIAAACLLKSQPPKISLEQQAAWLQARAELAEAKNAVTLAEQKYAQITSQLQAVCILTLKDGRPECAPEIKKK